MPPKETIFEAAPISIDRGQIRSIRALIAESFYVAEYQRGYKWTAAEVTQLLEDINAFQVGEDGEFYCLQPLEVALRQDQCWELIDGQQRMTTIYLILTCLGLKAFSLKYCTRPGTAEFLARIGKLQITKDSVWRDFASEHHGCNNIDNYHLFQAYQTIVSWGPESHENFRDKLLSQTGVIWHVVSSDSRSDYKKIFLHLNSGRIPLTNAELIKALFLSKRSQPPHLEVRDPEVFSLRQKEMAQEWDDMEYKLQDDAFWFFLNKRNEESAISATRMDFIFDLRTGKQGKTTESLFSYLQYAKKKPFDAEVEWKEVKTCYLVLREWFEGDLYHDVGFLLSQGLANVGDLYLQSRGIGKSAFQNCIMHRIKETLAGCSLLDDLSYGEDNKDIQKVLLLFNLKSLKHGARFPFDRFARDRFARDGWSLEHIHARNSKPLDKDAMWLEWVAEVSRFLREEHEKEALELGEELERSTLPQQDKEKINDRREKLQKEVFQFLGPGMGNDENDDAVNGLGNLALLSRDLNSSLGNELFASKRKKIISADSEGQFIPVATKNVFLKYYGGDVKQMNKWTLPDRKAYLDQIKKTLAPFLTVENSLP